MKRPVRATDRISNGRTSKPEMREGAGPLSAVASFASRSASSPIESLFPSITLASTHLVFVAQGPCGLGTYARLNSFPDDKFRAMWRVIGAATFGSAAILLAQELPK